MSLHKNHGRYGRRTGLRLRRKCMAVAVWMTVLTAGLSAQPSQKELDESLRVPVQVIARRYQDSVVLRWAPAKAAVWQTALKTGYTIERATVDSKSKVGQFTQITGAVLPWSLENWKIAIDAAGGDTAAGLSMEMASSFAADATSAPPSAPPVDPDDVGALRDRTAQFDMRYGFALLAAERHRSVAEGLGLRYVDRAVRQGESYVYRIRPAGSTGIYKVTEGAVLVSAVPYRPTVRRDALRADEQDRAVMLRWGSYKGYTGYNVERSEDGKNFTRLNNAPLITLRAANEPGDAEGYLDTGLVNYRRYTYRVTGLTSFADQELLGQIAATPRDRIGPGMPTGVTAEHLPPRAVKISWAMPDPVPGDLAGFYIAHDTADDGTYRRINKALLPAVTREYTDTVRQNYGGNYYVIEALDTAGNISRSFSVYLTLTDSTPPAQPRWIKGVMDTNGVVRLQFRANPERDLMGYRLLRANDPDHEFSVVMEAFGNDTLSLRGDTLLNDTVTVRTLTKFVYYRMAALDWHHNESPLSDILAVPRPDLIPPTAPVITGVRATDSSIVLDYAPSDSRDNRAHVVYRRRVEAQRWDSVGVGGRTDSAFTDRTMEPGVMCQYALRAMDSAGLKSDLSNTVSMKTYDNGMRPAVRDLKVVYDSVKKEATLSWAYMALKEKHTFHIYRGGDDGKPVRLYAVIKDATARTFTDKALPAGRRTEYAVKVVTDSGAESPLTRTVSVTK